MSAIAAPPTIRLGERHLGDVEMLRVGGYAPLTGFMTRADYTRVVDEMRLASGAPWSMPITLAVDHETAAMVAEGDDLALLDQSDRLVGHLEVQEKFGYDKRREAQEVYRTTDEAHPGVAALYAQGDTLLGGPVRHAAEGPTGPFPDYRLTPADSEDRVRGARLAHRRRVSDAQSSPPRARIHPEGGIGDRGRAAAPPAGRRDQGRRRARGRAHALLSRAAGEVLPSRSHHSGRVAGGDALCRPARGDISRAHAPQLRLHPLHRGARPRRRR